MDEQLDAVEVLVHIDDRVALRRLVDGGVEVTTVAAGVAPPEPERFGRDVDLALPLAAACRRWAELEPDPTLAARALASSREFGYDIVNERDWDAVRERFDPSFVVVDNRPASLGVVRGIEAWLEILQGAIELTPDARYQTSAVYALDPGFGELVGLRVDGTTPDGFVIERSLLMVNIRAASGLIQREELWALDDLDAARARYGVLLAEARAAAGVADRA